MQYDWRIIKGIENKQTQHIKIRNAESTVIARVELSVQRTVSSNEMFSLMLI